MANRERGCETGGSANRANIRAFDVLLALIFVAPSWMSNELRPPAVLKVVRVLAMYSGVLPVILRGPTPPRPEVAGSTPPLLSGFQRPRLFTQAQ